MKIVDGPLRRWLVFIALLVVLSAGCGSAQSAPARSQPVEVVSRPPASPEVLRAERLLTEGKVSEAKRIFEEALDADPNDARAWLDVGLGARGDGRLRLCREGLPPREPRSTATSLRRSTISGCSCAKAASSPKRPRCSSAQSPWTRSSPPPDSTSVLRMKSRGNSPRPSANTSQRSIGCRATRSPAST